MSHKSRSLPEDLSMVPGGQVVNGLSVDVSHPGLDSDRSLADVLKQVDSCHRRCMGAMGTAVVAAFEAGQILLAYREKCAHGEWRNAVKQVIEEEAFSFTLRTCQRYMKVATIVMELLAREGGDEPLGDAKTTRMTLLRILRQEGLLNISQVLRLRASSSKGSHRGHAQRGDALEIADRPAASDSHFLTPPPITMRVEEFFGRIDLDPCGASAPGFCLPAERTIAPPSNGLATNECWNGNVFVHPPVDQVLAFVQRTISAIQSSEASQAILLVPAVMDTDFAQVLKPYVRGFCRERPTFGLPSGEWVQPATGYMLVYVCRSDERVNKFTETFGQLTDVFYPHQ